MGNIILPYNPPQWIYEGNDTRKIEYNSGSVINRSPKQLQENILALKAYLESYITQSSQVTRSIPVNQIFTDSVVDSVKTSEICTVKWFVDLSYSNPSKKKMTFEVLASHNGTGSVVATEIAYAITSVLRFEDIYEEVPISLVLDTTLDTGVTMDLVIHTSVELDVRLTRIVVFN